MEMDAETPAADETRVRVDGASDGNNVSAVGKQFGDWLSDVQNQDDDEVPYANRLRKQEQLDAARGFQKWTSGFRAEPGSVPKHWSNYKDYKRPSADCHRQQKSVSYSTNNKYRKTNPSKGNCLLGSPVLSESTKNVLNKLLNDEDITDLIVKPTPADDADMTEDATRTHPYAQRDLRSSTEPIDFNKLNEMTAIEFDRDRYARFGVHENEIKDGIRTDTFKRCIELCAEKHIRNKVVLVVRCGIGFLPLLCARFGFAKRVIGLEQSACIEYARRIVNDNNYGDRITLIQSSVQDLKELPHELLKVDVIVSDCLGDCVLGQGDQMEQVIEARDRFLRAKGIMIPLTISLYGQLSEQRRAYENCRIRKKEKKVEDESIAELNYDSDGSSDSNYSSWWSNVYGFDMRSNPQFLVDQDSENGQMNVKWRIMPEPLNSYFNYCKVVSSSALLKQFNLKKCSIDDLRYFQCKNAVLNCVSPYTSTFGGEYAHMIELFMSVDFPNGKGSTLGFTTSSSSPCTRYKQTGLMLRDQLLVFEGDKFIINEFSIQRGPQQEKDGISDNILQRSEYEESLKVRLNYTFVNKHIKAIDRRCAYTVSKYLF